jgi:hypothetical protein
MLYFDRVCKVVIEGAGIITIEYAKIQFEIIKSKNAKENTAKVEIYNLAPNTRKLITEQEALVRIFAGYAQNKGLIEIGQGDISKVKHNRDKTEVVTEIYIAEGLRIIRDNPISISFSSKSKLKLSNVLDTLKTKSNTKYSFRLIDIDESKTIENGYSDLGSLDQILNNLGMQFGFEWSVQNGTITIKGTKKSVANEIMLLTPSSGLILHPESVKQVSRKLGKSSITKQDKKINSIQALLQPHLQIHDIIAIESQDLKGKYEIQKITHKGDTRGNDWYSDMEVISLN